jgi:glycosyltransferase involved in cell wall biosynthesis
MALDTFSGLKTTIADYLNRDDLTSIIPSFIYGKIKRKPITSNVDDLMIEDLYDLQLIKRKSVLSKIAEMVTKIGYLQCELITPISPAYIDILSGRYGIEKNKFHLVRGGVDLSVFKPNVSQKRTNDMFTVLYSGAFSTAYNFDQVLKAAKILEEKDSQIEFILQGKGELEDKIKLEIRKLNLNNVTIINRVLSRDAVSDLLNKADVLILPLGDYGKPHLGISSKLYEYQAVGKPIICCSNGMPRLYIKETNSGIVVNPSDYKAIANSILYLKENRTIAEELGKQGRLYVENNLTINKIGLQTKNLFRKLNLFSS